MGMLAGRAAVVTGAGRGIGRGHALHLGREGAAVVINDVEPEEAEKVATEVRAVGSRAIGDGADVGSRKGAEDLIDRCAREFGRIDILVNNAGILRDRSFLKMSDEEFADVWRVHVMGTFWCSQAAAGRMRDQGQGGVIINTTSAAHMGNFGQVNYSAAKGAIASMTYTMAIELARYGIRVNAISPSGTTRMSDTYKGPGGKEVKLPFVDPEFNAPVVVFLCSDEANYVTGQVFGTGGDRIMLLTQPQYGFGMVKPGGWTLEEIRRHFKDQLGNRLEPFGLQKSPYPFYGGVKPRGE